MNHLNEIKAGFVAGVTFIAGALGILHIPVVLMVTCNIIDYVTGLMAIPSRDGKLSSYRSMRGITKKVCMWLLVVVGAIVDELIKYAGESVGIKVPVDFLVACVVAIWIICSELISILENIVDIGVTLPPFLMPLIDLIKQQTEEKANVGGENERQDTTTSETPKDD